MAKSGGGFQKRRSFKPTSTGGKGAKKNGLSQKQEDAKKLLQEMVRRREQADAAKMKGKLTDVEFGRALSEIGLSLDKLRGDVYNSVAVRINEHIESFERELLHQLESGEINKPKYHAQSRMKKERMLMLMEEIILRFVRPIEHTKSLNFWRVKLKVNF